MNSNNRGGSGYMRGGRGRGRSSGRRRGRFGGNATNTSKSQERELKFSPHQYEGKQQAATYARTTKEALI
jgi:hypothetical protein